MEERNFKGNEGASVYTGALSVLAALFEDPKQAKQPDTWKRFFLSETFLGEQFSEEFGRGLLDYVIRRQEWAPDGLPIGFLQELAIAYALTPDLDREELGLFPGRRYAAEVFNIGSEGDDLLFRAARRLRQPGNKVRYNAFSDYMELKTISAEAGLTEENRETWQRILKMCQVYYLYERNGKKTGCGAYESRSECVVKLYVQWLKDENLPEWVLTFIYKNLAFRELERSSTRGLYGPLKEQVLRQLPNVEELLFGEGGKEQAMVKLYRICAKLINDHQTNYDHRVYEETPQIGRQIEELLAMPEWEQLRGCRAFFDKLCFVAKRLVMPPSLVYGLMDYLDGGDFPEPAATELTESLLRSLATGRQCREIDCRYDLSFPNTDPGSTEDNADFWQYYLMRGFGYRRAEIRGQWEEGYIYETGGECYLPAYIDYIYGPSRAWQRNFAGFDKGEAAGTPVTASCPMPDGRTLTVEFHYHYCLYFADGVEVIAPVLDFRELKEYAERLYGAREFFFLLAVTAIEEEDRQEAKVLIEKWLGKTPSYPFTNPVIAGLLAADNDRLPEDTRAVYYGEQERFCFRAVVTHTQVQVFRQTDFGWEDIIFRQAEFGWKRMALWPELERKGLRLLEEGKGQKEAAEAYLCCLRQPEAVCRGAYDVTGMDIGEKTAAILKIMGFFEKEESYCVLRLGPGKERRHDKVFYGAKVPFGFPVNVQSEDHRQFMDFVMSVSNTKIKERKRLAARFGWGFKYSHQSDYRPICVYQGESGMYYTYGTIKMHRAGTIEEVLADFLEEELRDVTEVEVYEGCLTVSRFDHRLEYCYRETDWLESMYSGEDTAADVFTVFGRYRLWTEFARWMDGLLGPGLPEWVNRVIVSLDMERGGALCFKGIHVSDEWEEDYQGDERQDEGDASSMEEWLKQAGYTDDPWLWGRGGYEEYCPAAPLLIWDKGMDETDRLRTLNEAVQWYRGLCKTAVRIEAAEP